MQYMCNCYFSCQHSFLQPSVFSLALQCKRSAHGRCELQFGKLSDQASLHYMKYNLHGTGVIYGTNSLQAHKLADLTNLKMQL